MEGSSDLDTATGSRNPFSKPAVTHPFPCLKKVYQNLPASRGRNEPEAGHWRAVLRELEAVFPLIKKVRTLTLYEGSGNEENDEVA